MREIVRKVVGRIGNVRFQKVMEDMLSGGSEDKLLTTVLGREPTEEELIRFDGKMKDHGWVDGRLHKLRVRYLENQIKYLEELVREPLVIIEKHVDQIRVLERKNRELEATNKGLLARLKDLHVKFRVFRQG